MTFPMGGYFFGKIFQISQISRRSNPDCMLYYRCRKAAGFPQVEGSTEMKKTVIVETTKDDIIETAKAYGIRYAKDDCWKQEDNVLWLPKSQVEVEQVTYEMYEEQNGTFTAEHYFQDGFVWVYVPMWLAREHGYFKHCVFHM